MRSVIPRTCLAAATVVVALALTPAIAAASGGGGCGRPVSEETGTAVDIRDYCFGPTILRVSTGREVTFINRDPFEHSVLGANAAWGDYAGFRRGKQVTYRFAEPGVYPYVCTFHVGMVGVVVVGGGAGGAIQTATGDGPVVKVDAADFELRGASTVPAPTPGRAVVWMVAASAAVLLGGALVALVLRRRRHPRTVGDRP